MELCRFISTHEVTMDDKSRILIPSRFRKDNPEDLLTSDFYVTPHNSGFLKIRPKVVWDQYMERLKEYEEAASSVEQKISFSKLRRLQWNISSIIRLDSQFRVVLDVKLRSRLLFEEELPKQKLIILGCEQHFEIWPPNLYKGEDKIIAEASRLMDEYEGYPT